MGVELGTSPAHICGKKEEEGICIKQGREEGGREIMYIFMPPPSQLHHYVPQIHSEQQPHTQKKRNERGQRLFSICAVFLLEPFFAPKRKERSLEHAVQEGKGRVVRNTSASASENPFSSFPRPTTWQDGNYPPASSSFLAHQTEKRRSGRRRKDQKGERRREGGRERGAVGFFVGKKKVNKRTHAYSHDADFLPSPLENFRR